MQPEYCSDELNLNAVGATVIPECRCARYCSWLAQVLCSAVVPVDRRSWLTGHHWALGQLQKPGKLMRLEQLPDLWKLTPWPSSGSPAQARALCCSPSNHSGSWKYPQAFVCNSQGGIASEMALVRPGQQYFVLPSLLTHYSTVHGRNLRQQTVAQAATRSRGIPFPAGVNNLGRLGNLVADEPITLQELRVRDVQVGSV